MSITQKIRRFFRQHFDNETPEDRFWRGLEGVKLVIPEEPEPNAPNVIAIPIAVLVETGEKTSVGIRGELRLKTSQEKPDQEGLHEFFTSLVGMKKLHVIPPLPRDGNHNYMSAAEEKFKQMLQYGMRTEDASLIMVTAGVTDWDFFQHEITEEGPFTTMSRAPIFLGRTDPTRRQLADQSKAMLEELRKK